MTFVEDDSNEAWEILVAPRGLGKDHLVHFLVKQLSEFECAQLAAAGYASDGDTYLYTGAEGDIAVAWADVSAAAAVQAVEGGRIVSLTLGEALARAAQAEQAFVLRAGGRRYTFDLTRAGRSKRH